MTAPERQAWLDDRRTGVGSSDAPQVCGLSPWGTPYSVYCSKVYGIEKAESDEMRVGTLIEPFVAKLFADSTGYAVAKPAGVLRHPDRPWQLASLDYKVEGAGNWPLEIKNSRTAEGWGQSGTDLVPEGYLLQVTHQMVVTGEEMAFLAALIGGCDFRAYTIRLDPDLAARLTDIEAAFWDRVQTLNPPEPDWSHSSTPALMSRLAVPSPDAPALVATGEQFHWATQYQQLGSTISDMEKRRSELKARLLAAMDQSAVMSLPDGTFIRRKLVERAGGVTRPSSYYDFRIVKK